MIRGDVMHNKQKGFLIALCLCLISVSGVYGVYQYQKGQAEEPKVSVPKELAQEEPSRQPEKEMANSEDTEATLGTEEKETEIAKIETEEDVRKIGEAELAKAEPEEIPEEEMETEPEDTLETAGEEIEADLLAFADDSTLFWPVDGDVILNYSMDKSIYFSTLNQYKYHPAIVISTEIGNEVLCAARGKVSEISVNEETGTTVYMELGSGYEAVYGQLKELAVEEGDTVETGELLGYVSEPTKYYSLEGSNLYFQLLKDGEPMNPMEYLE